LLQGAKSDKVLSLMASTFKALCNYADFSTVKSSEFISLEKQKVHENDDDGGNKTTHELIQKNITTEMHYNIQIHLPETRDITVYDAIFKSLKEHLL
jgi:hypothetical protein